MRVLVSYMEAQGSKASFIARRYARTPSGESRGKETLPAIVVEASETVKPRSPIEKVDDGGE